MVLIYNDGRKDLRPCLGTEISRGGGLKFALMANPDFTISEVIIDDVDDYAPRARAVVDADDETRNECRTKACIGHRPIMGGGRFRMCLKGDVIEVVKGRKYPHGTLIEVSEMVEFRTPSYETLQYVIGTNGERVNADNCMVLITAQI